MASKCSKTSADESKSKRKNYYIIWQNLVYVYDLDGYHISENVLLTLSDAFLQFISAGKAAIAVTGSKCPYSWPQHSPKINRMHLVQSIHGRLKLLAKTEECSLLSFAVKLSIYSIFILYINTYCITTQIHTLPLYYIVVCVHPTDHNTTDRHI